MSSSSLSSLSLISADAMLCSEAMESGVKEGVFGRDSVVGGIKEAFEVGNRDSAV